MSYLSCGGIGRLLHSLTPRSVLIGVLWLASIATRASATAAISPASDESRVAVVSGEFFADVPAAWAVNEFSGAREFTEAAVGEDRLRTKFPGGSGSVAELAPLPLAETPSDGRVPEPTTLALVGTGLIAIASAARRKRSGRRFGPVKPAIRYCVEQET